MKDLLVTVSLAVSLIPLLSCSKKDKVEGKSLNGSVWTYETNSDNYMTLKFVNDDKMMIVGRNDGKRYNFDGTYNYNSPDITMNFVEEDEDWVIKYKGVGTVAGDKMTVDYKIEYWLDSLIDKENFSLIFRRE